MMSGNERVDHAAEARDLLLTEARGGTTTEMALLVMVATQAAQVHATLALVEQQRIANLIALSREEGVNGIAPDASDALWEKRAGSGYSLRPEIREGLGL